MSHIDVLWFGGDTDMLVPEFAFEVEHTTDVTKGLGRLLDLHRSGQRTRLFVILPIDKMSKFDKEIGRSLFRDIKGICRGRNFLGSKGWLHCPLNDDNPENLIRYQNDIILLWQRLR